MLQSPVAVYPGLPLGMLAVHFQLQPWALLETKHASSCGCQIKSVFQCHKNTLTRSYFNAVRLAVIPVLSITLGDIMVSPMFYLL